MTSWTTDFSTFGKPHFGVGPCHAEACVQLGISVAWLGTTFMKIWPWWGAGFCLTLDYVSSGSSRNNYCNWCFRRVRRTSYFNQLRHDWKNKHTETREWNGYGSIPIDTCLVGWTSIYQLFWGSLGTRVLTHAQMEGISAWKWGFEMI